MSIDFGNASLATKNMTQPLVIALLALLLGGCAIPQGYQPEFLRLNSELVERALQPLRSSYVSLPGKPLGIYVGVALDGSSPAFEGDIRRARDMLFAQSVNGPSILLSNLEATPLSGPHADFLSMPMVARAAGRWLQSQTGQADQTPLAIVVIASHGQENLLSVRAGKTELLALINGDYLKAFLNDFGNVPTVVVVSACHAGSLTPALRAPNRIIIAAAATDRVSFGCGKSSTSTVFMQALLDHQLDQSLSIEQLYMRARNRVIGYEVRLKLQHSLPEIDVGGDMAVFATTPISQWGQALSSFRRPPP